MEVHPQVMAFKSLLKKYRRPKSTENIFFTWKAAAAAMGIGRNRMVEHWKPKLPPLPLTRQYLEQWRRNRDERCHPFFKQILEMRLVRKMRFIKIAEELKLSKFTVKKRWERGLELYDKLKTEEMPLTIEKAVKLNRKLGLKHKQKHLAKLRAKGLIHGFSKAKQN